MQARHPEGYQYPHAKPARYTDNKTSAYFTKNGLTQLGYIRAQLEGLKGEPSTSDQTKTSIDQIIALIDGLADKSLGSTLSVANRLNNLDKDLMKIFVVENGAIAFNDMSLLTAAKIITQGIAAIEPGDLDPPKAVLKTLGKSNYQLCETIKSTMGAINAQINFLIQLEKNAQASEALYGLMNNIMDITRSLSSITFKNETLRDERLNQRQGAAIEPMTVIQRVNDAIHDMNDLIAQYSNSQCNSITLRTMGVRLSPIATFDLMLKVNRSLSHITQDGHLVGDTQINPVFMATTVPFEALKLCASLKNLIESTETQLQMNDGQHDLQAINTAKLNLSNMATSLKGAIERKAGDAHLKENLSQFKTTLVEQLGEYTETAMAENRKKTTDNNPKLSICTWLTQTLKQVDLERSFTPDNQFSQYISAVANAYYEHNEHCATTGKSPGKAGEILVGAMNRLAELSATIVANDSCYYEQNIATINELLNIAPQNAPSLRP
ncbi:MAG TPA: hypothetical protein VFU82_02305 [Gammaproteobacteria bacterium]|nr:hypothetical protein [Gammaproteobacteria bacterium]